MPTVDKIIDVKKAIPVESRVEKGPKPYSNLTGLMVMLVVAQGPIYWLPGINDTYWAISKYAAGMLLIAWGLLQGQIERQNPLGFMQTGSVGKLIILFMIASSVGILSSRNGWSSAVVWLRIPMAFCMCCALYNLVKQQWDILRFVESGILIGVGVSVVYVLLCEVHIISPFAPPANFMVTRLDKSYEPYTMGFSYRSNAMSSDTALALIVCLARAMFGPSSTTSFLRRFSLLVMCLMLLAVAVVTNGRAGLLESFVFSIIALLIYYSQFGARAITPIFFSFVCILAVMMIALAASERVQYRMQSLTRGAVDDKEIDWNKLGSRRNELIEAALRALERNALDGVGLGQFQEVAPQYGGPPNEIHNLYLNIAVEAGLFAGFAAVILTFVILARYTGLVMRILKYMSYQHVMLYGFVVVGLLNTFYEPGAMFFSLQRAMPFWFGIAALEVVFSTRIARESAGLLRGTS